MTTANRPGQVTFPVRISPNGRYFADANGHPVFWLGTTQWQLFRDYTREQVQIILEKTASHGFVFAQVMLLGSGEGTKLNVYGEAPLAKTDPLTPNERYFQNVDGVLQAAGAAGVAISLTLFHQNWRKLITPGNARTWARWLAERYRDLPHIIWSMTPQAKPEFIPVLRELATGLREGDGGKHLTTFKPDPSPFSSSFLHSEQWLDFNSMQTWKDVDLIYPFISKDYHLQPVKPVLMAEGAYEEGSEYGFPVTPLWVRRQAYYSYLAGAHHTYGHNDSWRVLPTWQQALDAPGAVQMGVLKQIFLDLPEWWNLVPDQSIFAHGGKTEGNILNLAARHAGGRWIMAYLGSKATFLINMTKLATAPVRADWVNPVSGRRTAIGEFPNRGVQSFATPGGWDDALLVLEANAR